MDNNGNNIHSSSADRRQNPPAQLGGPSTSNNAAAGTTPSLDDAYEYVKAQEESGFGDPLIGNDDNFDILQYIGGNDTPEGSPAAAAFCGGTSAAVGNHRVIYQQQHHHHQQQLLNAAASELVQALQAPRAAAAENNNNSQKLQQQQQMTLDSVGLMMYNNNNIGSAGANLQLQQQRQQRQQMLQQQQSRLPVSPTDVSGGASSISPGGSSASGCESSSPFSPDQCHQYVNSLPQHHHQLVGGGGILLPQKEDLMLVNQMGQMMGAAAAAGHGLQQQRGGGMLFRGASGDGSQCMHSPNSEFLSPYPPSQSTPGSQHSSSAQVSPPAISHHQKGINYLLQQQTTQPSAALSMSASFASMDNLYSAATTDAMNGSSETEMDQQQQQQYNQQHGQKRRRMSSSVAPSSNESLPLSNTGNLPNIKSEIGTTQQAQQQQQQHNMSEQHQRMLLLQQQQSFDELDENMNSQKTIKFESYLRDSWNMMYDINQQQLAPMPVLVVADKGFNYSASDNCFVNQKKNHFQITVNIGVDLVTAGNPAGASTPVMHHPPPPSQPQSPYTPRYVQVQGTLQPILDNEFYLTFCGVKSEMQTSEIRIKQSQADRKPIDHEPEGFIIDGSRPSVRQTVARLHFGETTMNNHRKNGKPNPEQKFFLLVVKLLVKTPIGPVLVGAFHSDRVIVRASNPGQFEQPDQELNWQRGQNGSLAFSGQVCIGTEKPIGDAGLTVHGNIATTGNVTRPSDRRVKEGIADLSTTEAMSRVAQMRLVEYAYKPEIAQKWGLSEQDRHRVGVIAQELAEVLPEAVKDNGEFLTVDDTRVFYDTVAAAQELYRLTGNLESKIDQVEKISQKLARYAQKRKQLGSMASGLSDFSMFFGGGVGGAKSALAADKQSCVSYSRTSLTSTGTPANAEDGGGKEESRKRRKGGNGGRGEASNRQHYRCRSYSSASAYCNRSPFYGGGPASGSAPLCNSKFTQGTIVALVVIMAFCLVTMCTLYVLDWYNRTFQLHNTPIYIVGPAKNPGSSPSDGPGPGPMTTTVEEWTIPRQQNVPPLSVYCGSAIASLVVAPFASSSCPQYCCSAANKYSYEHLGDKLATGIDTLLTLTAKAVEHVLPPAPQQLLEEHQQEGHLSSELGTFLEGVNIEILNLNVSIDKRFCINANCNARRGRFDLYIPISEHLPTILFQLRISTEDPTLLVDGCGSLAEFPHKSCHFGNKLEDEAVRGDVPSSNKITDNIFEVSAGSFLQSAYRFRIGHTANLCPQEKSQRGRTFDEFNLVFYRTCAPRGGLNDQQQQEKSSRSAQSPPINSTTLAESKI